jgi:hypothetical protein
VRFGLSSNLSLRRRGSLLGHLARPNSPPLHCPPHLKPTRRVPGRQTALRNFALSNGECLGGVLHEKDCFTLAMDVDNQYPYSIRRGWTVAVFQSSPEPGGAGLSLHAPTFPSLISISGHAPQCSGNSIPHSKCPWVGPSTHQNNPRCGLPVTAAEAPYTPAAERQSCGCWRCWAGQFAASSEAASLCGQG